MALTYKSAGVDKNEGYNEVNLIKKFITTITNSLFWFREPTAWEQR